MPSLQNEAKNTLNPGPRVRLVYPAKSEIIMQGTWLKKKSSNVKLPPVSTFVQIQMGTFARLSYFEGSWSKGFIKWKVLLKL